MARLGKPIVAAIMECPRRRLQPCVACDMAVVAEERDARIAGKRTKGAVSVSRAAIVKDALPKKVLFDIVLRARLMGAAEAQGAAPCQ